MLLYDRVNTISLLHRKNFYLPSYKCELCQDNTEETTLHLFWDCHFALSCWDSIIQNRSRGISIRDEVVITMQAFPSNIAMEIVIMGCWHIWMQRNSKIFQAQAASVQSWKRLLKANLLLLLHRAKRKTNDLLSSWVADRLN